MTKRSAPIRGLRTQEEVARIMGMTKQGIYKIEKRAMEKLRKDPRVLRLLDQILEKEGA